MHCRWGVSGVVECGGVQGWVAQRVGSIGFGVEDDMVEAAALSSPMLAQSLAATTASTFITGLYFLHNGFAV